MFHDRQRATLLAALRFWQCRGPVTTSRHASPLSPDDWAALHDIATDCGQFAPLKVNDIDRLCDRIQQVDKSCWTVAAARFFQHAADRLRRWTTFVSVRRARVWLRKQRDKLDTPSGDDLTHTLAGQAESDARCDECQLPSFFCSGVPGIVAHVESGRLSSDAKVERSDTCRRYPSDLAALAKLRELGF